MKAEQEKFGLTLARSVRGDRDSDGKGEWRESSRKYSKQRLKIRRFFCEIPEEYSRFNKWLLPRYFYQGFDLCEYSDLFNQQCSRSSVPSTRQRPPLSFEQRTPNLKYGFSSMRKS
ncbi:unnamed protein product [Dovyalis caffra]|uniref:Uncharacterized protein n=1 Tax=Dovyalis caffra TaxID=77055 RepID=A0AAV1R3R6_9ROSI|nr:unnamed protein product [Dovyalis caffra]